jgi:DNA-binding MarR family transcriptional regulator
MTPNRRLVTDLLKALPDLGRMVDALCELHLAQLERQPLLEEVKRRLREAAPPTQTQMQLAIELAQEGPATIRQLASRLGVTPAAVSLLVDRMVDHGWVERERDEEDRRVVWARLTPMAQSMSEALLRVQRAQVVTFLAEVPEHEREPFVRNLAHFARVLARANDKGQLQTV